MSFLSRISDIDAQGAKEILGALRLLQIGQGGYSFQGKGGSNLNRCNCIMCNILRPIMTDFTTRSYRYLC